MSVDFRRIGSLQPATDTGQCGESYSGHVDTAEPSLAVQSTRSAENLGYQRATPLLVQTGRLSVWCERGICSHMQRCPSLTRKLHPSLSPIATIGFAAGSPSS